jgi:hypothetical protein
MAGDRIIDAIRSQASVWTADATDDEIRRDYIPYFSGLAPVQRGIVLKFIDDEPMGHISAITKDTGRMLQTRRQLEDIHERLLRAGK